MLFDQWRQMNQPAGICKPGNYDERRYENGQYWQSCCMITKE